MVMVFKRALLCVVMISLGACSTLGPGADGNWVGYTESGEASYYADRHQNQKTASGERYQHAATTAAHKTLPFGTRVKVTNVTNGKSVVVRINDRGPFVRGRIIDLSKSAFASIANLRAGVVKVKIEVVR